MVEQNTGIPAAEMQNIKRWRHDQYNDITHHGEKPISNFFVTKLQTTILSMVTTNDKQQKPKFSTDLQTFAMKNEQSN